MLSEVPEPRLSSLRPWSNSASTHCQQTFPIVTRINFALTSDHQLVAVIATALVATAIFVLALVPLEVPPSIPGTDKLHHLIAFALATLPSAALWPRAIRWVVPALVLEAGFIETVQPYVNRMCEWADFAADLKGIGIGLAAGLFINFLRKLGAYEHRRGYGPAGSAARRDSSARSGGRFI